MNIDPKWPVIDENKRQLACLLTWVSGGDRLPRKLVLLFLSFAILGTIPNACFENLPFQHENVCEQAIHKLKDDIKLDMSTLTSNSEAELIENNLLCFHKRCWRVTWFNPVRSMKLIPIQKWKALKPEFPLLYHQLRTFPHIVATSVPAPYKRLFSNDGLTFTTLRNRLTWEQLEKLLFLDYAREASHFGLF